MPLSRSPSPVLGRGRRVPAIVTEEWTRPSDWVTLPTPGTQEFIGLVAVYDQPTSTNAVSLKFSTSSGTYHVDWGDGDTADVASSVLATHNYDYADSALAGTECWTRSDREYRVTFTDAGDLVNLTAHGFSNDQKVQFAVITTTTGISTGTTYYIVNNHRLRP